MEFCANALNPADILDITVDEKNKTIIVTVPNDQLSLAIGKRGQNARLASKLIGWNIDITSDQEVLGGDPALYGIEAASGESDAVSESGETPESLTPVERSDAAPEDGVETEKP